MTAFALAALRFLRSIHWTVYLFAAVVALALWYGERRYDAGEDHVQAAWEAEKAETQAAIAAQNQRNRQAEQQMSEDLAAAAAKFEDEKARAIQDTRDSVLADLRNGTLKLRVPRCANPAPAGQAASTAGLGDGEAGVRGEDALDLAVAGSIAIGTEADAHVRACQAVIEAYHQ